MKEQIASLLKQSIAVKEKLGQDRFLAAIEKLTQLVISCLKSGGKIILFGNGGSAADAQHIAAEFIGRFSHERKALAAIALSGNSANLTCLGNDYGFERVFSRQIEALGQAGDLAVGISTSGSSPNVLTAMAQAKSMGLHTAALTSEKGQGLAKMAEVAVCIPATETARIQEAHITIGHIVCELAEKAFLK